MASTTEMDKLPQVSTGQKPKSHTDRMSVCLMDSGGGTSAVARQKNQENIINVATWNIKTLLDSKQSTSITIPRRTAIIAKELQALNIDIVGLQEVHMKGFGKIEERNAGYTYYWSGSDSNENRNGVAICVRTSLIRKGIITEPTCLNERLMSVEIIQESTRTAFICAYAPTEVDNETQKDKFYEDLESTVKNFLKKYNLIIAGDLNARIGQHYKQWPQVIGKHGPDKKANNNGRRLLNLCVLQDLCIPITWFQQRNKKKTTWKHPRSGMWHMIDCIIVRRRERNDVIRCEVMRSAECETDHRLICARIKLKTKQQIRKHSTTHRFNNKCLQDEETRRRFQEEINKNITPSQNATLKETWTKVKTTIMSAAKTVMEKAKPTHRDWFDESDMEIMTLLKNKKLAFKTYLAKPTEENETKYKTARRECQRGVRTIRDKWWSDRAAEMQRYMDAGDSYNLYNSIKSIIGPPKKPLNILIDDQGSTIKNLEDRLNEWSKHFKNLFNQEAETDQAAITLKTDNEDLPSDEPPTRDEILKAITHLKNNRSPGSDNITTEMLKGGENATLELLHALFEQIWREKTVPEDWKKALVVPIHKKGNKNVCGNYRGISLLSAPSKVLSRLIYNRLYPHINLLLKDTQCGFRGQKSTIDMVFTVRQMVEKSIEQNTPLCIAFIDISKAFDSVDRSMLFKILKNIKCPPTLLEILKSSYEGTISAVKIENEESPPFEIKTGVRQGCVIAPLLFVLYMQGIIENVINKEVGGICVKYRTDTNMIGRRNLTAKTKIKTTNIVDLMFADDCALLAKTPEALQDLVNIFVTEAKKFGLRVNEAKTEIMFVNCRESPITINGHNLQEAKNIKYLGSNIQNNGRLETEINHRVNAASQAFRSLYQRVWKPHEISLSTKLRIYQTIVLSTLLYSAETWTVLERDLKILNAFHMKSLRTICRIKWEEMVPNEEVLKRTRMMSITNIIRQRRMRWAGHLSRMGNGRTPQQVAFGELQIGKRLQQKPKKRWIDLLKNDLKETDINLNQWRSVAEDRGRWRKLLWEKAEKIETESIAKKEIKRKERHEEEDQYIWSCPLCNFEREGRNGKQYVNSHISQKHKDDQAVVDQATRKKILQCEICDITCKTRSGLTSHLRNKHPQLSRPTIQPIKRRKVNAEDATQTLETPTEDLLEPDPVTSTSQQPDVATNPLMCGACGRVCKTRAGLISHQRNVLCRAKLIGNESSESMHN